MRKDRTKRKWTPIETEMEGMRKRKDRETDRTRETRRGGKKERVGRTEQRENGHQLRQKWRG